MAGIDEMILQRTRTDMNGAKQTFFQHIDFRQFFGTNLWA